jgi:hypothetical protein
MDGHAIIDARASPLRAPQWAFIAVLALPLVDRRKFRESRRLDNWNLIA